jgi:hypothetical protein
MMFAVTAAFFDSGRQGTQSLILASASSGRLMIIINQWSMSRPQHRRKQPPWPAVVASPKGHNRPSQHLSDAREIGVTFNL